MKKIFTLIILMGICIQYSIAQTGIPKAQAMFVYNFSRLIEWPATYKTGPFVIGVLGSGEISGELNTYTTGKKVGVQDIIVKQYKDPAEIDKCHILFVTFAKSRTIGDILNALNNKSTLIITEKNGLIEEGAAINFVVVGDKLKFEISQKNAEKYGIKFSAKLTEMAFKAY
ncbi:MAG: YfiR family protein [Bacteroidales bacterium]|nr:YfiR family protein [Bacteroidales bacterium]